MTTPSEPPRLELLNRFTGAALRAKLAAGYDRWLAGLMAEVEQPGGFALVAVGSLGRREPAPYADLDLVLVHDSRPGIAEIAEQLWYPIWDAGLALDHSVRTPAEALAMADEDLKVMLGLLDCRHLAGDAALTGLLREQVIARWRRTAPVRLAELRQLAAERWRRSGDAAFLLEPDLKDSRGGLREWVGLRALASAQLVDVPAAAAAAAGTLLDVRGELHRVTGRGADVLRAQDRSAVAEALGWESGDEVLRRVSEAARTLAYATDTAWRRVAAANPPARPLLRRLRGGAPGPVRQPLASGVVAQDGEVVLARNADPWADPVLLLRVARAAASADLPIAPYTLTRLDTEAAPLPEPWPAAARAEFIGLLGAGAAAVPVFEALDQHGLLTRLIPEWEQVRFRAQHNPVHRYTVDRHLIETAVQAGLRAGEVGRPDLLLVGALLHDIGKGQPGDHSVVGATLAGKIASRLGFAEPDAAIIAALARHHLLLPHTATRRDLADPSTVGIVAGAIDGSAELLDLLYWLTIADAAATGPAAWSDWKAGLVSQLVRRVRREIGGEPPPAAEPAPPAALALAETGRLRVAVTGSEVLVAAPDGPGLLSAAAGLLALHGLDVRSADVHTVAGMAVNRFVVSPRFGTLPDEALLNRDLRRIRAGELALADRLRAKENSYRTAADQGVRLIWFDDQGTDASVLEVRTHDAIGLLHRLTGALERAAVNIRSARISSLGPFVVDAFYLTDGDGKPLSEGGRAAVEAAVTGALTPPV